MKVYTKTSDEASFVFESSSALPMTVPHSGAATALWPNPPSSGVTSYALFFISNNWLVRDVYDIVTQEHDVSAPVPMQQYEVELSDYFNLVTQFTNAPCDFQAMTDMFGPAEYLFFKGHDMYSWTDTQMGQSAGTLRNLGHLCR